MLMELKHYIEIQGRGGAKAFAVKLGISSSFLSQLISGRAPISPIRCVEIEHKSQGMVTRKDLRPFDWKKIWPELNDNHLDK